MRTTRMAPVLGVLCAIAGCIDDEEMTNAEQASYFGGTHQVFMELRTIPVCWLNPGSPGAKEIVRSKIAEQYESPSNPFYVRFVGWGDCAPTSKGIRIQVADERPGTLMGLANTTNAGWTMKLNFTFDNWGGYYCDYVSPDNCIRANAVHEFGHALGLQHEHSRADTPSSCDDEEYYRQTIAGAIPYGPYDASSIMNYCNGDRYDSDGAVLSAGDRAALGRIYPVGASVLEYDARGYGGWFWRSTASNTICTEGDICETADIDGDGKDDLVEINAAGRVRVKWSRVDTWGIPTLGGDLIATISADLCKPATRQCLFGNLDADARDEALVIDRATNEVHIAQVESFGISITETYSLGVCASPDHRCKLGDVDNDGDDDLVVFTRGSIGDVLVAKRTKRFWRTWDGKLVAYDVLDAPTKFHDWFCYGGEQCEVGDVNADGRDDIITFSRTGPVWVSLSAGTSFGVSQKWHDYFCVGNEACRVADFDGDARVDIITLLPDGMTYTAFAGYGSFSWLEATRSVHCVAPQTCAVGEVNGDGHADLIAFTPRMTVSWNLNNFTPRLTGEP